MKHWSDEVGNVINRAAKNAGLPKLREGRGVFDGDSWIWAWFEADEPKEVNASAREVLVRVHPDALEKGIEIEASAVAWLLEKRQIAEKRNYYTRYVELGAIKKNKKELERQIEEHLRSAWAGVHEIAKSLPALQKHRDTTQQRMHEINQEQTKKREASMKVQTDIKAGQPITINIDHSALLVQGHLISSLAR